MDTKIKIEEWKEDKPIHESNEGPQNSGWDAENIYI